MRYSKERRTTRAGALMSERLLFADLRLANSVRIEHALAIAGQPDPSAVMRETTRELATWRGTKDGWRRELAGAVAQHPRPTLIVWGTVIASCPPVISRPPAGCSRTPTPICSPVSVTCRRSNAPTSSVPSSWHSSATPNAAWWMPRWK